MFRIFFLTIAVNSFFLWPLQAQDLHYYHYTVDKGLASSQVHDIVQDKYGRLWFSTDNGLSCFDGYKFRNYTLGDGLTDDVVFKFYPQPDGKIWCTTFNRKVFYISGKEPVFTPYRFNSALEKMDERFILNSLAVREDGSLFMGVLSGHGYIHINGKGAVMYNDIGSLDPKSKPHTFLLYNEENTNLFFIGLPEENEKISGNWKKVIIAPLENKPNDYIKACYLAKSGYTVFTNSRVIQILSKKGDTTNIPAKYEPISLGRLTDDTFWVGFRYGGIAVYNLKGKRLVSFLAGKSVTRLLVDHEGGYWFSTLHDGVFHARNTHIFSYSSGNDEIDWINTLSQDSDGRLWMGYYHGNISVLEANKIRAKYLASDGKPSQTQVNQQTGEMFFVSDNYVFRSSRPAEKEYILSNPLGVHIFDEDSIVMCGYGGVISFYRGKRTPVSLNRRINDLCYQGNKCYLATNNGLYTFVNRQAIKEGLEGVKIIDIKAWKNQLLLATKGSGVLIWDAGKVQKIDRSNGLCDNVVYSVYAQNDTVAWACTHSGLSRMVFRDQKIVKVRNFSTAEGLVSNEVSAVEIIRDTIWIGTRQGLCYFPLRMLDEKKPVVARYFLHISGLKVNDKNHPQQPAMALRYDENRLEFSFGAISFSEFERPLYRYRLQGLEAKWNYTEGLSAVYASLPPHAYTFILQVKASGAHWSAPLKYAFTIYPPFWKTWWFILSAVVLVVTLIYLFFRFRILSYNRDMIRELLRQLLKWITRKTKYVVFREQGVEKRILTNTICFVKSDGNYIEIHTDTKKYVIRYKIGDFLDLVPDPLEYLRISRSYIIRIDKIQEKGKKEITVNGEKIAVGETYLDELKKIKF